jgi:hypothetical protein
MEDRCGRDRRRINAPERSVPLETDAPLGYHYLI